MASLYGDLPPPETKSKSSSSKDNDHSSSSTPTSTTSQTKISKLYNFSPPVKSTVKSLKKPIIPASWTTATQFKPTQRKPITKPKTTIKSITSSLSIKPKNNNSNEAIPVPTIISTEIITKKKEAVIDNSIIEAKQNSWLQSSVSSKKRKQNNSQSNKNSMSMEYDPKYPNEYEVYKREKKMKKKMEKERKEMERKMEEEMRHSHHHHHHHSHHNSPPPQPIPQPVIQPPVPQSKDMTGEEAYLMRARLSSRPVQTPQTIQQSIPTRVVLLTNLVGAGEVDDTLQEETAEECEKYGVVERCLIFEVKGNVPDDEAVRIFIKFGKLEEAAKGIYNKYVIIIYIYVYN